MNGGWKPNIGGIFEARKKLRERQRDIDEAQKALDAAKKKVTVDLVATYEPGERARPTKERIGAIRTALRGEASTKTVEPKNVTDSAKKPVINESSGDDRRTKLETELTQLNEREREWGEKLEKIGKGFSDRDSSKKEPPEQFGESILGIHSEIESVAGSEKGRLFIQQLEELGAKIEKMKWSGGHRISYESQQAIEILTKSQKLSQSEVTLLTECTIILSDISVRDVPKGEKLRQLREKIDAFLAKISHLSIKTILPDGEIEYRIDGRFHADVTGSSSRETSIIEKVMRPGLYFQEDGGNKIAIKRAVVTHKTS